MPYPQLPTPDMTPEVTQLEKDKIRVKGLLAMWKVEITDPKIKKVCLEMYRAGAKDQLLKDELAQEKN